MSHSRGTLDVTIVEGRHLKDEGRHLTDEDRRRLKDEDRHRKDEGRHPKDEGHHLKDEHVVHKNDAYVEVYVDKDYKQRTKIVKDSNDPKWNQKFTFLRKHDDDLHLYAYDDYVDGRDSIGSAKIDLKKHVFGKGHYDEWVKLSAMLGLRSTGELHVIIEHRP